MNKIFNLSETRNRINEIKKTTQPEEIEEMLNIYSEICENISSSKTQSEKEEEILKNINLGIDEINLLDEV